MSQSAIFHNFNYEYRKYNNRKSFQNYKSIINKQQNILLTLETFF